MTDKAKFKYSASKGTLELEGSEEFVTKHFESLTDIVRIMSRQTAIEQKKEPKLVQEAVVLKEKQIDSRAKEPVMDEVENIQSYPEVFSEINGKLKIVSEIPGNTKSHKMTNAALLYCFGASLMGDEQVSSVEIRRVCEEHGFLDSTNFW